MKSGILGFAFFSVLAVLGMGCAGNGTAVGAVGPYDYYVRGGMTLVKRDRVTGGESVLMVNSVPVANLRLSPDKTKLAFSLSGVLHVMNSNGSGDTILAGYKMADWSSDGSKLYAITTDNRIRTINPDGTGASMVIFDGSAGGGLTTLDVDEANLLIAIAYAPTGWRRICTISLVGTNLTPLSPDSMNSDNPRFNLNRTAILYDSEVGPANKDIILHPLDGSAPVTYAGEPAVNESQVSPRGDSTFLYTREAGSSTDIWVLSPTGSSRLPYLTSSLSETSPEGD